MEDDLTLTAALYGALPVTLTRLIVSWGRGLTPGGVEGEQTKEEPERSVKSIGAVEDDLTLKQLFKEFSSCPTLTR